MDTLKLDEIQRYFDEVTGQKLSLWFGQHNLYVAGVHIFLKNVPLLKNEDNGNIYLPDRTKEMICYFLTEAKNNKKAGAIISPKNLEHTRYNFANKFNFLYSNIDYEYVPGLMRPFNGGFLCPVFFNISVLNKYSQHPDYKLDLFSETYGNISKKDGWIISFGINKNKKVVIWLGDIDSLPENEKYYLRSENIPSDHEIHSEFYDAQIAVMFSEPSKQTAMFHLRKTVNDDILKIFSFDLYHLDGEVSEIISNLDRPVFWEDKHISPVIESFNRIFVECINNEALKLDIKTINNKVDVKNKKSLKLFQLWLEERLSCKNAGELMCPFYVLYDFRVMVCHLQSIDKKVEMLEFINSRLGLDKSNYNYETIYDSVIDKISFSYKEIRSMLLKL